MAYGKRWERETAKHGWLRDRRLDAYTRCLKLQSDVRFAYNGQEAAVMVDPSRKVEGSTVGMLTALALVVQEIHLLGPPDAAQAADDLNEEALRQMAELDRLTASAAERAAHRDTVDRWEAWRAATSRFERAATAALE